MSNVTSVAADADTDRTPEVEVAVAEGGRLDADALRRVEVKLDTINGWMEKVESALRRLAR